MTDTVERTSTDTSTLEEIAPKCCLVWTVKGTKIKACDNVAVWVGFTPCCGNSALVCDEHFQTRHIRPLHCRPCKMEHHDLIGWQHL